MILIRGRKQIKTAIKIQKGPRDDPPRPKIAAIDPEGGLPITLGRPAAAAAQ